MKSLKVPRQYNSFFSISYSSYRRRRLNSDASKKMSSDSILTAGEHLWTYNSMKQPINGGPPAVLMYSNQSNAGSRLFHHTPTTMRSYVVGSGTPIMGSQHIPIRHSESTTLRLNPGDGCSAYHTVSVSRQNGCPPSEVYEEIAPIGMFLIFIKSSGKF